MEAEKPKMIYRYLGNTGLKVSLLSFGNWLTAHDKEQEKANLECLKAAHKGGVNFFDTAEIYGMGVAEEVFGVALKEVLQDVERKDIVVSTKIFKCGQGVNDTFLSRKHIIEGTRNSLKRLQLDYVDVVFCHRPDFDTPLEETCRAMSWLIDQGLSFYWGTSEWPSDRIHQAVELCERKNLHKPVVEQCQYSMIIRENFEKNLRHDFENYGYGTTIWSPLAGGLLTGKYNDGNAPEGTRYGSNDYAKDNIWGNYMGEKTKEKTVK